MAILDRRLRGWTPIAFRSGSKPLFEWADLRDQRFEKPFFSQTIKASNAGANCLLAESSLSVISALDSEPSLDPDVIIAHPSRCGSTLFGLLAAAMHDQSVFVGEPQIVAQLLEANLEMQFEAPEKVLRQVVRALGRIRFGTERRYVLKLSSQASRFLPLFRQAFPETPIIWVQRDPVEIIESNFRSPAKALSGLSSESVVQLTLRKVLLAFLAAHAFKDDNFHVIDYRSLPFAAWTKLAPLMLAEIGEEESSRMHDVSRLHSHNGNPFLRRNPSPLPDDVRVIVRDTLDPLYAAVAKRALP